MAGGLLSAEYTNSIKPRLENAIDIALVYMGDNLQTRLLESALLRVYSYHPAPWFAAKRRYELLNETNYPISNGGGAHSIEIRNTTVTQGGASGEVNWVESGFRQHRAGARPFMEEGLQDYVAEQADADLMYALSQQGF